MTNRKAIWLVALLMIVGGAFWFHEVQGKQIGESFTAMTFNVGTFNSKAPDMLRVRELISRTGIPDVLLLQEVPGKKQAGFLAENLKFQSCVFENYPSGKDGLAIISKHPLKKLKTFYFGGHASLAAEADIEGEKVLLLSVHLERFRGGAGHGNSC
jgi:exonuclease III